MRAFRPQWPPSKQNNLRQLVKERDVKKKCKISRRTAKPLYRDVWCSARCVNVSLPSGITKVANRLIYKDCTVQSIRVKDSYRDQNRESYTEYVCTMDAINKSASTKMILK